MFPYLTEGFASRTMDYCPFSGVVMDLGKYLKSWTVFGAIRWALTILLALVLLGFLQSLLDENYRTFIEAHGWDSWFTRAVAAVPELLASRGGWFAIGILFGACALLWLVAAFPDRLGREHSSIHESKLGRWGTVIGIAMLFACAVAYLAFISAPFNDQGASDAQKPLNARITSLQTQLNSAQDQLLAAQSQNADLTRRLSQPTPAPPSAVASPPSKKIIEAKIDLWKIVQNTLDDFSTPLNDGSLLIDQWPKGVQTDRASFVKQAIDLRNATDAVLSKLNSLPSMYVGPAYTDDLGKIRSDMGTPITLYNSAQIFYVALQRLPADLPSDYEYKLRPFSDNVRMALDDVRVWQANLRKIAAANQSELAAMEPK
jgi:outer membrane murein-binding lipoprotein Lpp